MYVISSWFYSSPQGEDFDYPGMGLKSSDQFFQLNYFRCVLNFFASAYFNASKNNINLFKFQFFYNQLPSFVVEIEFLKIMEIFNVELIIFEPSPLPDFVTDGKLQFGSQFYEFDVVDQILKTNSSSDVILLVDNDCIILNDLEKIFSLVSINNSCETVIVQPCHNNEDVIQGNKVGTLHALSNLMCVGDSFRPYVHRGGEYIFMNYDTLFVFHQMVIKVHKENIKFAQSGNDFFTTEEQIFSQVYRFMPIVLDSGYLKRSWTDPNTFCNSDSSDLTKHILHLPADKQRGLKVLFDQFYNGYKDLNDNKSIQSLGSIYSQDNLINIFPSFLSTKS